MYRINAEYAQLYGNRTQDSRDLNEPPSNIRNGLGVFSAFNISSVFFEVAEQRNDGLVQDSLQFDRWTEEFRT